MVVKQVLKVRQVGDTQISCAVLCLAVTLASLPPQKGYNILGRSFPVSFCLGPLSHDVTNFMCCHGDTEGVPFLFPAWKKGRPPVQA